MMSNSSTSSGGGASVEGGCPKSASIKGLKKGPWTTAEDTILIDYVKKHGEGNWNSVQKNSGLLRCGKSCRLRWANHLRPNLKKGSFTPEEERIIIELHAKLGNKWARMASQLPGRTDNEIKNFWNTRMKRRQRGGLPIYPQEFHEEGISIQQKDQQQIPNPSSSSFSSFLSSRKASYNPSLLLLDPINFSPTLNHLQKQFHNPVYANATLQFKSFVDTNGNNTSLALPLSTVSQTPSALSPLNHISDRSIPRTPPLFHYDDIDFENNNMNFTSLILEAEVEPNGLIPSHKSELPSIQTPPHSKMRAGVCFGETSSKTTENHEIQENKNSGLLDALLLESHDLLRKEKSDGDANKEKRVADDLTEEEQGEKETESTKRVKLSSTSGDDVSSNDMSSSQSSIGTKPSGEPLEEINSMDDDLLSLLDNFPSSTPLPEWYRTINISEGLSSSTTGDGRELESHQDDSSPTDQDTPNSEWGCWTLLLE